ncbi:MAG: oligosaccharide flippase family protein [Proteobacteria bacterium]|nr:oligosaccharide flippase family protein [Pseudomonadota bacterium]
MGLFKNTATVFATSFLIIPFHFLSGVILARYLTLADRGFYTIALALAEVLLILGNVGWPAAVVIRLRRYGSEPAKVVGTALWAWLLFSTFLIGLCFWFRESVHHEFLGDAPPFFFLLTVSMFPFMLLRVFLSAAAEGMNRFDIRNGCLLWLATSRTALLAIVLIILAGNAGDALGITWASTVIGTFGIVYFVVRLTGINFTFDRGEFRHTITFGAKAWVHSLAGNIHERVDILMLSSAFLLGDHEQVALYVQAVAVLRLIRFIPSSLVTAILPHLAEIGLDAVAAETARVVRHGTMLVFFTALGLLFVGPWLIPLVYGAQYTASVIPFLILLPGVVFQAVYMMIHGFWAAIDRQRVPVVLQLLAVSLNIVLNLCLIPPYGFIGAALASLISYAVESIAMVLAFRQHTGQSLRSMFVIQPGDITVFRDQLKRLIQQVRGHE